MPTDKTRSLLPLLLALLTLASVLAPARRVHAQAQGPRVIIDSSPPGAAIYIDGKERGVQGYSSSTFKIRLSKGPHRILLELEGYKPVEQVINVTQAQKYTFTLERAPARIDVRCPGTNDSARGGEVFVDGAPAGTVPVPVEVPSGRHLIEVRKAGYRVYSETVELRAGDTRTIWVTLQPEVKSGALFIASDAPAEVFVDGQPRGPAPVLVDNLREGEHMVEVRRTEPGAPPWRQNVRVVPGPPITVNARTQPAAAQTGSLRVLSSVSDAEVSVDGQVRGQVGKEIGDLKPGQHVVEVFAKGFGRMSKVVEIEAGKIKIEKVELPQSAEGRGMGTLRLIMVNPVEGAQYYINGRRYDESVILHERGMEVAAGPAIIVVRRDDYGEVRKEVTIRPGAVETVSVELRNVGRILVMSDPRGAKVMMDKQIVGQTPYTIEDVPAGPHMIELTHPEYSPHIEQVVVRGGVQSNMNVQLQRPSTAVTGDPMKRRGLSSFSALTLDPGHFTIDAGAGYPYFIDLRITVGAVRLGWFGLDAGAEFRTSFYQNDVNLNVRAQLLRAGPLVFGANLLIGGGGGPRRRNEVVFEVGVPITLIAGNIVRLTARPYLQVYSDRLCPSYSEIRQFVERSDLPGLSKLVEPEHSFDRCVGGQPGDPGTEAGYYRRPDGNHYPFPRNPVADAAGFDPNDQKFKVDIPPMFDNTSSGLYDPNATIKDPNTGRNVDIYKEDGVHVLDRFTGARFIIQAVVEVAITNTANLWLLLEGAPFQKDRQAYRDRFNFIFPTNDFPLYGRAGFTLKF